MAESNLQAHGKGQNQGKLISDSVPNREPHKGMLGGKKKKKKKKSFSILQSPFSKEVIEVK